ncbi:MAG: AAA family ATPase [Parabacteroides sp.]|nr:AAA family ATPase [Parabacteroides sp.]
MFKRKITDEMLAWKNTPNKKALIVKGLRQVGKTTSVRAFAQQNYENVVYVNFKSNNSAKRIFDDDLVINRITTDLSALLPDARFVPYKTVIIFDEIQECANARSSIKAFVEDGRYDVIGTGSLLGIKGYNKKKSKGVPVGFEKTIYMKPMDFEEFLWAKGIQQTVIDYLKDSYRSLTRISETTHRAMIRYFKEYICVGGMPRVVNVFVTSNDMNAVYDEQRDLIEEYKDDFGKHLDENEQEETNMVLLTRINNVFDSIPAQLAKENKKFVFSAMSKKGRSSEYMPAIQWLKDYGLINFCYNLSTIDRPLEGYKIDNIFKLYFVDSGLFISMLERGTASKILNDNLNIYKGAIYENIIADAFSKNGISLYYFHKESGLEIDFVSVINDLLSIVEVKARTGNSKSAKTVLNDKIRYNADNMIKLGEYNIGVKGNMITLPFYLSFLLQ